MTANCITGSKAWLQCALNDLTAQVGGEAAFGLLIGGIVIMSLYLVDRSMATASVILILAGGFLIPTLPAGYAGMAGTLVVLGVAAGLFSVGKRYVLNPGVAP
jgi:hypothetical protein